MRVFTSLLMQIKELIKEWFGYPIQTAYSLAGNLLNWELYGNSEQSVSPTPSAPIEVKGVGDKTINLFDMKYDVGYTGSYPNITTVSGGQSTEWIETSKFGQYFYFIWNIKEKLANCVLGLVYSNDKSEILYRDGLVNSSIVPTVNTDYVGGGGNPYKINPTYTYVKFYFLNWANVNHIGIYTTLQNTFIPYGYQIPVVVGSNCGVVNLGTLSWIWRSDISRFESVLSNKAFGTQNLFTSTLITGDNYSSLVDKSCCGSVSYNKIFIRYDEFGTDANALKTAMSGVYLYYQRTTDESWQAPTIQTVYLSEPLREESTFADYIFYGEGKNLFDNTTNNKWITVSGEITEATGCCVRKFMCNAGDVFVLKAKFTTTTANNIICVCAYDANGNKLTRTVKSDFVEDSIRFICPSSTAYIYAGRNTAIPDGIMLIKGYTVPTEYQPYSDTPKIVRYVGTKILNGTENIWDNSASITLTGYRIMRATNFFYNFVTDCDYTIRFAPKCTHFVSQCSGSYATANKLTHFAFNDAPYPASPQIMICIGEDVLGITSSATEQQAITAFKSWLATQHANGTPMTIYYPMETSTSEPMNIPALNMAVGTNIITSGTEVEPFDMYAKGYVSQL